MYQQIAYVQGWDKGPSLINNNENVFKNFSNVWTFCLADGFSI